MRSPKVRLPPLISPCLACEAKDQEQRARSGADMGPGQPFLPSNQPGAEGMGWCGGISATKMADRVMIRGR